MKSPLPVSQTMARFCRQLKLSLRALCSLVLLATPFGAYADINPGGSLSQFEVYNDSGQKAHGFEIQIQNGASSDLYYTGYNARYLSGNATAYTTPTTNGVNIRWQGTFDPGTGLYAKTTPLRDPASTSFSWQDCYLGGSGYATSGCEIFGQGLRYPVNPGMTANGYWLIEDPQNRGSLMRYAIPVAIPTIPTYTFPPPVTVSTPPAVVVTVEAPEPPSTPEKYGDAQWIKVFKTELTREATEEDLKTINGIVPTDPSQIEIAWNLLQASPPSNGSQNQKGKASSGGAVKSTARAIVRRIETYKYTGAYDAVTHRAVCADTTCTAPSTGESGSFIGANNTAVNINPDALTVVKTGNGTVSDATKAISCGSTCSTFATKGALYTLTANPGGNVFTGWSGLCTGKQLTCLITVDGVTQVNATFAPQYTLSIGHSNTGTVTGIPAGNDKSINCGGTCSAKFTQGAIVTLTATPPAGKSFVNWSGGCSGTAPNCSLTINRDTSVQAVFSK